MKAVEAINHIVLDEQGVPWIKDRNIKVIEVALDHLAYGWSADAIHEQHPGLSLAEIHSALAFYYDHQGEFDELISKLAQDLDKLRATTAPSPLQQKLRRLAKLP